MKHFLFKYLSPNALLVFFTLRYVSLAYSFNMSSDTKIVRVSGSKDRKKQSTQTKRSQGRSRKRGVQPQARRSAHPMRRRSSLRNRPFIREPKELSQFGNARSYYSSISGVAKTLTTRHLSSLTGPIWGNRQSRDVTSKSNVTSW